LELSQTAAPAGSLFRVRELTSRAFQASDGSNRVLILVLAVGTLIARSRVCGKRKASRAKILLEERKNTLKKYLEK
jgi:hypothetical protein